jgi:hypothetical protein
MRSIRKKTGIAFGFVAYAIDERHKFVYSASNQNAVIEI